MNSSENQEAKIAENTGKKEPSHNEDATVHFDRGRSIRF
jgi:hypothetical protein